MKRVLIIAEAGVNHNGDIEIAKKLIDASSQAGADVIKFQTFKAENLASKSAKLAKYQSRNLAESKLGHETTQFSMLKKLELSFEDHLILLEHCKKNNITFFSTAFDLESIDFLNQLNMPFWKIPSGEITNLPYLEKIGRFSNEVILSTGMSSMTEIEDAISVLLRNGTLREKITVLHCNTEYPTPMHDVNLLAMLEIKEHLNVKIGYSDHTLGIEVPIAAVALGAEIIEKHFTLDRKMEGPDHKASIEPKELKDMIDSIRNIEKALGSKLKEPTNSEKNNMAIARKSIHLNKDLDKGHELTKEDLVMKRPGDGISPMKMYEIVGKRLNKCLSKEHKLSVEDLI
jgi:N,N'-diacetyllegionaminate synthase